MLFTRSIALLVIALGPGFASATLAAPPITLKLTKKVNGAVAQQPA